jgi:hypothetical protein
MMFSESCKDCPWYYHVDAFIELDGTEFDERDECRYDNDEYECVLEEDEEEFYKQLEKERVK